MRVKIFDNQVNLWLSTDDTYSWAHRSGNSWPCSELAGKRLFAAFDRNGLCDISINGRDQDCDSHEFNAITSDFLETKLDKAHSCYFVTVGQFR